MQALRSYLQGSWHEGGGEAISLVNPATEEVLAHVRSVGSLADAVAWGRTTGGQNLRALTFARRGEILSGLAKVLHDHRESLISLAVANGGNTRGDAKFDIDGAAAVLASYAELSAELGETPWIVEGEATTLLRTSKLRAQQIFVPRRGLAIHINAFNFPAWGLVGKAAVSFLAGVPVLSKPATSSALLAHRIAELFHESGLIPAGAFQMLAGPAGDLLEHVGPQDVIAFTGSASTAAKIRSHEAVIRNNVRVNLEADGLNASIVGPDVEPGSELFDLVIRDAVTEMTQKAGQKCTATRRMLVANSRLESVKEVLLERLEERAGQVGNPADKANRMGPLATAQQLRDARAGLAALTTHAQTLRGDPERTQFNGVEPGQGYFLEPILLAANASAALNPNSAFHHTEVFGPVSTLLPYDGSAAQAATILGHGGGSLVSTIYANDRSFVADAVATMAPHLGRLVLANEKTAQGSLPPGGVFPQVNHGGPGRAGGGEELGGRSGMLFYLQRTTLQGGASQLARLLGK